MDHGAWWEPCGKAASQPRMAMGGDGSSTGREGVDAVGGGEARRGELRSEQTGWQCGPETISLSRAWRTGSCSSACSWPEVKSAATKDGLRMGRQRMRKEALGGTSRSRRARRLVTGGGKARRCEAMRGAAK